MQDAYCTLVRRCDQVAWAAVWGCLHLSYKYWRLIYEGKLKAYKSLEAYYYFYNDNVHSYCVLAVILEIKAQLNPLQSEITREQSWNMGIIMREGSVMTVQHAAHMHG